MPKFRYKAVGQGGQVTQGVMEAESKQAAIQSLQDAGHLPISAQELGSGRRWLPDWSRLFRRRNTVSRNDTVLFMSELATLLQAGLPLDHALRTMEGLTTSDPLRHVINAILQRVQGGANLSDAMADHGDVFNRLQISMVRAGEASGALYSVIGRLADYMERMNELRSTIITSLIYPAILLVMAVLSLFILLTFVVPKFVPLFEDVGQALPLLTQIVFGVAGFLQHTWWLLLCIVAAAAWFIDRQLQDPDKRRAFDGWCLRLPLFGDLIAKMETARFSRTLGTLVANGVPLLSSIELVREVINNRRLAGVMKEVSNSLEQGQSLALPLRESELFPPLSVQLIEVGEESGNLDEMLMKVADIYDREVQTTVKRMLTVLEPILIVGLGGLIGIIIISILMAMLGLNELVV